MQAEQGVENREPAPRRPLPFLATAYALGTFNDNFFKQSLLLLAVAAGNLAFQGYALAAFTAPFLLLAAPAGWLADRLPKHRVALAAKTLECLAMVCGAVGLLRGSLPLMLVMLAIMGVQATFFSPALNGAIPELYPAAMVPRVNGVLRLLVTAAILAGVAASGVVLELPGPVCFGRPFGYAAAGALVIGVAVVGWLAAWRIPALRTASPGVPFPWRGPWNTLLDLREAVRDPGLRLAIGADVFIWFAGSLELLLINPLGIYQLGLSKSATSGLLGVQLGGVAIGGFLAGRLTARLGWQRLVGWAGVLLAAGLLALAAAVPLVTGPARLPVVCLLLGWVGIAGGLFMVPVESEVQILPAPDRKGRVWAACNFAVFAGILLSSFAANGLLARWSPATSLGVLGAASVPLLLAGRALAKRGM